MTILETYINGQPAHKIDVNDRGLQFGDGVFETIAVHKGVAHYLQRHISRLESGCRRLAIQTIRFDRLADEIRQHALKHNDAVIKIIVTRGETIRGYGWQAGIRPNIITRISELPVSAINVVTEGACVRICETRLSAQPILAGIKHLNRLEQVLARAEWNDDSIHEGLLADYQDAIIEGTMSNIFIVKKAALLTPELSCCGVAGIQRSVVMDLARESGINCHTGSLTVKKLKSADEVFVCNSLIGIWPVKKILDFADYPVGPVTRNLQEQIEEHALTDSENNWYSQ